MKNEQIVSNMNSYLHTAAKVLAEWLGELLPKATPRWWEECVMDKLSPNQAALAQERGFTELGQFDLAALLRIADKSWYVLRGVAFLPSRERGCLRDMMRVRNNWAHLSATLPGKDSILKDIDTLYEFFSQRECEDSLLNDIDRFREKVKAPATADNSSLARSESQEEAQAELVASEEEIKTNSQVYLTSDPNIRGIVMNISDLGGVKKYGVFVKDRIRTYYSGQIALYQEERFYNWVDINTFRSYLAAYQINNPSANGLYSLNSARIDFVPYQFRPALKLIHADEPRILIADSVGVGKTIEAGLIIKELQARKELENILIICPKPLVAERKWELEMQRFDEDFVAVDGPMLRQIISDTDRDGEWPVRYSKVILPYSILDSRTYEGETSKRKHSFGLRDLDPAPHFDLVIIDEAHHIRNGSMEKEKAFEYKCVKYFCDNADAVVMLTATPLQTSNDDLFTLLNVLRPDVVIDKQTFYMMAKPNAHISKAASLLRGAGEKWQEKAKAELEKVLETQWGEKVVAANPSYKSILKTLQQNEISRNERVQLITETESLHSFNTMLNRTRRKDIQDFCIRRTYTVEVDFTRKQQELYDELMRFETNALLQLHGSSMSIGFLMATLQRQAASCIFGLAPHIRDLIDRRFQQIEYEAEAIAGFSIVELNTEVLKESSQKLLELADRLPEEDPKFDQMLAVIWEKQKQQNNKIIVFSTYRYTLAYLKRKLLAAGLRVGQVDGSVRDYLRQELRDRFARPKDDKDALDILLFSEVGSEGLDYQFCNMMINYDLPWNPMVIEQRIGRIDRRGQQSETISIYNMITKGTVDAEIYSRCLIRIGIFASSIGECEEILGDIARQIDQVGLDSKLTREERQQKLEQIADNEVRKLQEINRLEEGEKELLGFDLSEYVTTQEINEAENQWLDQRSLQVLVEEYLQQKLGKGRYLQGEGEIKQLRLAITAREELRKDLLKLQGGRNFVRQTWDAYLKGRESIHPLTFNPDAAERRRDAFFITAMHPLAKQAAAYFASNEPAYIRLQYGTEDIPAGEYRFSVYAWNYVSLKPRFRLQVVCDDDALATELREILQQAQNGAQPIRVESTDWDALEAKQAQQWQAEKASELARAEGIATYKLESLENNFRNRQRSLEQKIADAMSDSIRRMYMGELENATERYEGKVAEIKKQVRQTDIHSTLIANGILSVVN